MVTDPRPDPAGRRLHDRYRLEASVAAGGMGTVYSAVDERLGRRVAVKVLRDDLSRDATFVERFRREARSVAALAHPNIATVFDYGEENGTHFIVMELAEGRDLSRVVREEGRLSPDRAVRIAEQICDALAHAHSAGVVHRDVKPANVIVGEQDLVKVTDFGIARATGDSTLTATGSILGSAHYLSPEQANGAPAGFASDIYSTGIVVYEMLTGSLPFTGDSPVSVAMRHVTEDVPPPSALNSDVPPALDVVLAKATARAPENRYRDTSAMATALQAAMGGESEPARATIVGVRPEETAAVASDPNQTVWPIPGSRWNPNRIGRLVAIMFAVLLALAIGLLVWRLNSDDETRAQRGGTQRRDQNRGAVRAEPSESQPSPSPTVPDVVDQLYDEAETELESAGFEVKRNDDAHEDVEEGVVFDMNPAAGSVVAPGSTITLFVSTGEEGDEGENGDSGPPGHGGEPPGQAKKDKDKD